MPSCQKLKTKVKRRKDQKLGLRNFDARKERIETGAVVTSKRGLRGIERGKGVCYQWKAKGQCSRGGDQWQFPVRRSRTCKTDTKNRSILWATNTKRWKCVEKKEPQRQESVWEDETTAVQKLLERYLH